jgi:hypothetical protein
VTLATGIVLGLIYMPLATLCAFYPRRPVSLCTALSWMVRGKAFGQQTKFYPDDRAVKFAGYLHRNYNLDITFAAALEHIQKAR